jgi:CSLREA domain-containing protein
LLFVRYWQEKEYDKYSPKRLLSLTCFYAKIGKFVLEMEKIMKRTFALSWMVLSILVLNLLIPSHPVRADSGAYLTVNSNSDADNGADGVCTLREAMWAAIGNVDYHECINSGGTYGGDEIHFSIVGNSTITLTAALPAISTGSLTIFGDNAGSNVIIDGANTYSPFYVTTDGTLILHNLTIQNSHSTNIAGAILVYGVLEVYASTFLNNSAVNDGGAIVAGDGASATIVNSTFSGNSANYGGAISNNSGNMTILNSTLSGNSATTHGSALGTWQGGAASPVTTIYNSILANGTGAEDCWNGFGAGTLSGTKNIIETTDGGAGSCSGIITSTADPALGALTGSPAYFPLNSGSPAIDTGDNMQCAAQSQNGIPRPQDGDKNGTATCDVGSFEAPLSSVFRSQASNDGWVLESTETSNAGGSLDSTAVTFRIGDDGSNRQYRAILSFDTSALPDTAVITKVTLKVKKQGVTGTDPFTVLGALRVDIRKPFFGNILGLENRDFQAAGNNNIGNIPNTPVNGWYSKVWPTNTFFSFINLTGTTQFRLRFLTDDNNNHQADYMSFFSGNHPTAGVRPMLVVQYYVP